MAATPRRSGRRRRSKFFALGWTAATFVVAIFGVNRHQTQATADTPSSSTAVTTGATTTPTTVTDDESSDDQTYDFSSPSNASSGSDAFTNAPDPVASTRGS
jgi:hypothetical protein